MTGLSEEGNSGKLPLNGKRISKEVRFSFCRPVFRMDLYEPVVKSRRDFPRPQNRRGFLVNMFPGGDYT